MTLVQQVARPMLAGMFVYGGLDSARNPDGKVKAADRVVGGLTGRFDAVETHHLVRANGIAQVAAGAALATGLFPRTASVVLAATLAPTTFAGHRFWDEEDPRRQAPADDPLPQERRHAGRPAAGGHRHGRPALGSVAHQAGRGSRRHGACDSGSYPQVATRNLLAQFSSMEACDLRC
jgi:uncharacterized membrane protein YphA (DoxX/SURF4 family)